MSHWRDQGFESEFEAELGLLINRYSEEERSGTPDYILARFLWRCLQAWNAGVSDREVWYDRPRPHAPWEPTIIEESP